ncbi:MAG: hypothetical protein JWP81_267 [Ferruginibacter sp.]|nr:hypothetical protein [Ferruginibacter sp.]
MINTQNQRKVFLVIIAILLLANISMLAFFLQKKAPENKEIRPDRKTIIMNFLQKEIGFNSQQLAQYDTLSKQHREKISSLFDTLRKNKTQQFKQLVTGNFGDSVIEVLADQSAASQKIIEVNMFKHIRSIRNLCTPEQLPKYDSLFGKIFNRSRDGRKKTTK